MPVHICYTCILTLLSSVLDITVIYTLVLILARHLAFAYHSPGEFHLTPLDPHVQVLEHWSVWILPVADQSSAAVAWIFS